MKYVIFIICIMFLAADAVFEINPIIKNIVYGLMTLFAAGYLYIHKSENGLDNMFKKDENAEKKSIFNIKDLFKK